MPDAVGQAVERYLMEKDGVQEALPLTVGTTQGATQAQAQGSSFHQDQEEAFLGSCPECGAGQLAYEEGCMKCHVCGYSECG
jgi:ribonucleoside-diphosphate reductase alpha chain